MPALSLRVTFESFTKKSNLDLDVELNLLKEKKTIMTRRFILILKHIHLVFLVDLG